LNLFIRIELCVVNLVQKSLPKVVRISKWHPIFVNFGVKNFAFTNNTKKNFDV
jgi:hypothetical protein